MRILYGAQICVSVCALPLGFVAAVGLHGHRRCRRTCTTVTVDSVFPIHAGLYTYDLLSCRPCCQRRCTHCNAPLPLAGAAASDVSGAEGNTWRGQMSYYSYYSLMHVCAACGARDYHYLKRAPAELALVTCATPPTTRCVHRSDRRINILE